MNIAFDPEEADYVAASRANYLAQIGRWRGRTRLVSIVAVLILVVMAGDYLTTGSVDSFWPIWLIFLLVLVPVGVGVNLLLIPRSVRRLFAQQPGYREPMTVGWTDEGFAIDCAMTSHRLSWNRLRRWKETADSFLVYPSDTSCLFIPKRAFDSTTLVDFRRHLDRALPRR